MLAHRAVRGAAIILASSYFNLFIGFVATIILTRMLSPDVFGLFNLAVVFFALIDVRNKLGIDAALIHRQLADDALVATHWLLQMALALTTLIVGVVAAWILPQFGYSAQISRLMVALCFVGVVEALGSTARVLLEKELRFGRASLVISSALLLANVLAIAAAWLGAGIWSLVVQAAVNVLAGTIGFWLITPVRPRLTFSIPMSRWLLRFGLTLSLAALATIVLLNGDNFMVGTFVGVATLGYYERAYKVAQWPTGLVTHVVSRAAMPTYSKLQNDRVRLGKAFALTVWLIISVATPLALALFVSAPDFVRLIFGEQWAPSGVLLRYLVGYSVLRPLLDDTGALLNAVGKPHRVTQLLVLEAVALAAFALPLTLCCGAGGTALGVGITFALGVLIAYRFVSEVLSFNWHGTFATPLVAALASLICYWVLIQLVDVNALPLLLRVLVKGGFVAAVFAGILLLIQRDTTERAQYVWRLLKGQ